MVAADAAAGHDHRRRAELEFSDGVSRRGDPSGRVGGLQHRTADADNGTVGDDEFVDAVPVGEPHPRLPYQPAGEDVDDRRARSPGDVEARHRITVPQSPVTAALGPSDQGEGLQSPSTQPAAFLPGGEVDIGVRPLPRPVVLGPVEPGGAQPVLQRQFLTVADTEPALFGAVDEEQPAERPECLSTQVGGVFLVQDQHAMAPLDEFARGDQPGETRPHDNDIGVCHETQH
ncbi:Uncharacterised protein [Mycolicibacterium fortuitum]|uniref:Uncharacterized protein n=1 Tax=Mycolicibacterium fortuitum TaxID=1766 RepID=A0A378V241_MYCFO|nr:Uncharacterised protein [Mycolicibacterium fortuitum]